MVMTAILFLDLAAARRGDKRCFGCRFNNQVLPKEIKVVGFMVNENGGRPVQRTVAKPEVAPHQQESWDILLAFSLAMMIGNEKEAARLEDEIL